MKKTSAKYYQIYGKRKYQKKKKTHQALAFNPVQLTCSSCRVAIEFEMLSIIEFPF